MVLISGGVGITPMQAMLETLVSESSREVHFVDGALDSEYHADAEQVKAYFYQQAQENLADNHYRGLINRDLFKQIYR